MAGQPEHERSLCVGGAGVNQRDLFVIVADLDAENAIRTLLVDRQHALEVRLDFNPHVDLLRYVGRDSGCYKKAVDLLRPPQRTHRHAMLIFDRHGCGAESKDRVTLEHELESKLHANGWATDAVSVIVIEPELEAWVWSASPRVADVLGWEDNREGLRPFLEDANLWDAGTPKPTDPQKAMQAALRAKQKPLGARLFADLASRVGVHQCQDAAFRKFSETLQRWFVDKGEAE